MNSNSKPHRWAEVIKAWADGREIQLRKPDASDSRWHTYAPMDDTVPAFDNGMIEWRIKPEQKTGWIIILDNESPASERNSRFYPTAFIHPTREAALQNVNNPDWESSSKRAAVIQINFFEGEGL
jgi:hypothetical protein